LRHSTTSWVTNPSTSRTETAPEEALITYDREIIKDGFIQLSDKPGLGLDVVKDVAMRQMLPGETWWG
jgi:L-alanine-DL-glutamate epimerase-like enolase superfamily enzyme